MLKVLPDEHRRNFRTLASSASFISDAHRAGTIRSENPANLLLFYAVEVGLKYLLNQIGKIPFRHEVTAGVLSVENYSHDVARMVADLKVPAGRVPVPPKQWNTCVNGYDDGSGGQRFQLFQAHEAWRYGLTMEASDERDIQTYLVGVLSFLVQEIAA